MSDAPTDYNDPTVMRATLAKIDRDRAETQKLFAEVFKLNAEGRKFSNEGDNLNAERRKFDRERWIVPLTVLLTVIGGIAAGAIARLPEILHAFGWGVS